MKFIVKYERLWNIMFFLFVGIATVMSLTGCAAPAFLTDLEQIIPIAAAGVSGILSIIATFAGQPELAVVAAGITAIASKVQADLQTVNTLISQYQSNPSDTLLENIENEINTVIPQLSAILQVNGLPQAEAAQVQSLVSAIVQQLEALLSVLPVFKSSTAGQSLSVLKPITAENFKTKLDAIVKKA